MSTLLIVESPAKAKTIQGYLGAGYIVAASFGHVRDLPVQDAEDGELVVGIGRDFRPRYEPTETGRRQLARLRELAGKADAILLATDPDREGEAIAWHLRDALRLRAARRITFNDVSAETVKQAISAPRDIDMNLVQAQEARRVLDRLVGYAVSPVLSRNAGKRLSAGRVQSVAVRLVVDREREIRNFRSRQHFGVELEFPGQPKAWTALWKVARHLPKGQDLWTDQAVADRVAQLRHVVVEDFQDGTATEAPPPPFTTSTLQQEASKRLGWGTKAVMDVAQALFDRGLITYHRTDNPNLDEGGAAKIRAFAQAEDLPLPATPRRFKSKAGAQEAHGAIRPVDVAAAEVGDTEDEKRLYALIRARAVASQLADAVYATRNVELAAVDGPEIEGAAVHFEAKGRVLTSQGWRVVNAADTKDEGEEDAGAGELSNPIPALTVGQRLEASGGRRLDKMTKPPARYTEAGLVKALEDRGIGRPATYAAIIGNIMGRSYVVPAAKGKKALAPGPDGEAIVDALVGTCSFIELDFTAQMEADLDAVSEGQKGYVDVVRPGWERLAVEIGAINAIEIKAEHHCPDCGKALNRRKGSNGFFWGCTGYPECRTTLPDKRGKPGERKPPAALSEFTCRREGCGKPLVRRHGRTKAKKGKPARDYDFYSCSGYPACDQSYFTGSDGKPDYG